MSIPRLLSRRVLVWWPVKMTGTALAIALFFPAYLWVLGHPWFPVTVMPWTALDQWIGLQPAALPLYLSLWFYVSLVPALMVDRRELWSCAVAWIALSAIGLGIFMIWPTAVPAPDVDWSLYPALRFLKSTDATGNACPSLHVAFAVFSAVWFGHLLARVGAGRTLRILNWLWCAGILYSTMAIRQHVALDVLAGAGLGAVVASAHLRWLGRFRAAA